jgi:CBS domain-containing protein
MDKPWITRAGNMMKRAAGVFHVNMRLHPTWYPVIILLTWVHTTQFPGDYPLWQRALLGLGAALVFFITMNIRQVFLNIAALIAGAPVKNVWLYAFGGSIRLPRDTTRPLLELVRGLSGLFVNILIAVIFQWVYLREVSAGNPVILVIAEWMAFFWYLLAIFHILPGLPLEDGQVLLAVLWSVMHNYMRAVRITAWFGRVIGVLLGLGGTAMLVFQGETVNGLLFAVFGWVLITAARHCERRALLLEALRDTHVSDVMSREYSPVSPRLTLEKLINDYILVSGKDYYAVVEDNRLTGVINTKNIRRIASKNRPATEVSAAMTRISRVKTISAMQTSASAIEMMDQYNIDEMPVLGEADVLEGIIVRDSLERLAAVRGKLKV